MAVWPEACIIPYLCYKGFANTIRMLFDMENSMASNKRRDSQRKKVHAAVAECDKAIHLPLADMTAITRLVTKVASRATLSRRYGKTIENIEIRDGRGYSWATGHAKEGWITVPRSHRSAIYVLRAMAYVITGRQKMRYISGGDRKSELGSLDAPWHGWEYCAVLMDLVRYGLGETEGNALKAIFVNKNVSWTKPIVRTMTDEQKDAARIRGERLAAQNYDRKRRAQFADLHPGIVYKTQDEFEDYDMEIMYRVWK